MIYEEKTMKSEKIYEGRIINLRLDTVELPDKKYTKREIVEHPGAVAIIPVTEDNEVVLVKQYRKAVESELLEIPAGKVEIGENPVTCAVRELKEETGYSAKEIQFLFEFYTSPGFSNEKLHLFLAKGLSEGEAEPENDEYIEVCKIKLESLVEMINNGELLDSKTVVGVLTLNNILNKEDEK
ncbi:NUDIX hydrolase [Sporosalibacterium faouarense]|uniref:NUDIX hydrolase n=1 Tax=Sporosalibacterium faouarense TaxID=516123 RepID=UPI00141D0359|nr:NUDIX hydrolase [Sporosalibacterium faouarense]MTI48177.1 NUDIX hydrolase [Bacillota bacterium]